MNRLYRFGICCLLCTLGCLSHPLRAFSRTNPGASETGPALASTERDGRHDFDFDIGTWELHVSRLLHPLTGSSTWVELEGTVVVRKLWGGRANLAEIEAEGPAAHLEILSVRLYDRQSREWSLNFATSKARAMAQPMIGQFRNGRGESFDRKPGNGGAILVRFAISAGTPDWARSEPAFSENLGKTWEVNWINTYTRASGI